jgi:hypothetical protein
MAAMYDGAGSRLPPLCDPARPIPPTLETRSMPDETNLGEIASTVTSSTSGLTEAITGASYAAGVAFSAASVEKFKREKDGSEHHAEGTPLALDATAAALLLVPTIEGADITKADVESAASKLTDADLDAAKTEVEKLAG